HGLAHSHLVDVAHVEDLEPLLVDKTLLARIDAADSDLTYTGRGDRRSGLCTQLHQLARPEAAQACERHAVQIAARRKLAGVEVGVGIQPQHTQLATLLATMPRYRADRADTE